MAIRYEKVNIRPGTFWSGCVRGYDNSDRLELDGDVDLNVNTED